MATTTVYDLSDCPCCGDTFHIVSCNDVQPVPNIIYITITFNGITVSIPLTWITSDSWAVGACFGGVGWAMESVDPVEICPDFFIAGQGIVLCCDGGADLGYWDLTVVTTNGGAGRIIISTPGAGGSYAIVKPFTVIDPNPLDMTTQTTTTVDTGEIGSTCGNYTMYFEFTP